MDLINFLSYNYLFINRAYNMYGIISFNLYKPGFSKFYNSPQKLHFFCIKYACLRFYGKKLILPVPFDERPYLTCWSLTWVEAGGVGEHLAAVCHPTLTPVYFLHLPTAPQLLSIYYIHILTSRGWSRPRTGIGLVIAIALTCEMIILQ